MLGPLALAVAEILDARFKLAGIDQYELGRLADISQSQVSKYLRGASTLNLDRLDRLCTALGLDVAEVVAAAHASRGSDPRP